MQRIIFVGTLRKINISSYVYDILFVSSRSVSDAARCLRGLKRARFIVEDRIKGGTRIFCEQNFWLSFRTNQMYLIDPVRFGSNRTGSKGDDFLRRLRNVSTNRLCACCAERMYRIYEQPDKISVLEQTSTGNTLNGIFS